MQVHRSAGTILVRLIAVIAVMAVTVGVALLPTVVAADSAVASLDREMFDVPPLPDDFEAPAETSFVYAADGSELDRLHGPQNRVHVPLTRIPEVTRQAVVATEDAGFHQHNGVDHRAILRAAVANARAGAVEAGASTITQQYVRNVLLASYRTDDGGFEKSLARKVHEAAWAVALEEQLSKDEILERYLNTAYFGNGVYGIGTAARYYFGRDVSELDAARSALLAGLIRAPELNDPIEHPDSARGRRDIVLRQMRIAGFLTAGQMSVAQDAPLGLDVQAEGEREEPFLVEWVKRVAFDPSVELQPEVQQALGPDKEARQRAVFEGGLRIHTTVEPAKLRQATAALRSYLEQPEEDPLGGVVSVEPGTGAVRSVAVGPKSFGECPEGQRTCDVTKVYPIVPGGGGTGRPPGSSFKAVVMAAALADGVTPAWAATARSGEEIDGCHDEDGTYDPENYDGANFGRIEMATAAQNSVNVYFVKLAREIGVPTVAEMAADLGIRNTDPPLEDFGPSSCSVALGTVSVYPLEMATAYAAFANGGVRCDPHVISRIEDRQGNVLYEHEPTCERVLDEDQAAWLAELLQGPPSRGGTAPYVGATLGRPVAGKTGTTTDWKDAWFVGFVPQLATAAWVGYETPVEMFGVEAGGTTWPKVTGGSIPARIWADYMVAALEGVDVEDFPDAPPIPSSDPRSDTRVSRVPDPRVPDPHEQEPETTTNEAPPGEQE
ncbi:MAG: transglycosylase domain-containing protein [Actinobacteria bacterium]|nr:transglycosylase domain-containing protein [Actinomycetota bacterium]